MESEYKLLTDSLDRLLAQNGDVVTVAIDGRCASGKTTLAAWLEKRYDCNIFHMDDFFLRPEQRTPERFSAPGGNVDYERFLEEILLPLSEGREVFLRRFDCHSLELEAPVRVPAKRLNIIEGAYSMHPELRGYYSLTLFLRIDGELQRERILKRNSGTAEMFFSRWIPLEEEYFRELKVEENADLVI